MSSEIKNDKEQNRFVIEMDGSEAFVKYNESESTLDLYSTFTPPELRGKGLAEKVVRAAFEYARANNLKVIPTCPYIPTFLKRNEEYLKDVSS